MNVSKIFKVFVTIWYIKLDELPIKKIFKQLYNLKLKLYNYIFLLGKASIIRHQL